jgi:hypothetical protein
MIQKQVNWLLHIIIFIGIIAMFIFGIWNFAHAPKQPKATIYVEGTFYQTRDKNGNIIYANKDYEVRVK